MKSKMQDNDNYDYLENLGEIKPDQIEYPEREPEIIPAGTYKVRFKDVVEKTSKTGNLILITTFTTNYNNKPTDFKFVKALPSSELSGKEKYKNQLFRSYIHSLGINSILDLKSCIGKVYTCDISYNNDFLNVKIIN
jgi:hypothetical protein